MIKISVIIPIYNGEEHLKKCIDSVLKQTEKNIEIILVDDGSKDNSLDICRNYAKQDSRIVVIHQENYGVSVARNIGIGKARGEYIGFVDSDDWIEPDMYETLLRKAEAEKADVVMCDVMTVYSDGRFQVDTITQLSKNQILNKSNFTPSLLLEMAGSACRCIYKNNRLMNSSRFFFPIGVKFSEDRIFNIYALGYANRTVYIKEVYYNRYMNEKSVVHQFHKDYFEAYKKAAREIEKALAIAWDNDKNYQVEYLKQLVSGALMSICNYYYRSSMFSKHERKEAVKKVCADQMLRKAIEKTGLVNIQTKWIMKNRINLLILYAKMANWKHKR